MGSFAWRGADKSGYNELLLCTTPASRSTGKKDPRQSAVGRPTKSSRFGHYRIAFMLSPRIPSSPERHGLRARGLDAEDLDAVR